MSTLWYYLRFAFWTALEWVIYWASAGPRRLGSPIGLVPRSWAWWAQDKQTQMWYERWDRRSTPKDLKELILQHLEHLEETVEDEIHSISNELHMSERSLVAGLEELEERINRVEHKLAIEDALDYAPDPDPSDEPSYYVDPALIEAYHSATQG